MLKKIKWKIGTRYYLVYQKSQLRSALGGWGTDSMVSLRCQLGPLGLSLVLNCPMKLKSKATRWVSLERECHSLGVITSPPLPIMGTMKHDIQRQPECLGRVKPAINFLASFFMWQMVQSWR